MKDELKREICTIAHSGFQKDYMSSCECDYDADKVADSILSLFAPTIEKAEKYDALLLIKDPIQVERKYFQDLVEKAEKWDKVKECANSRPPCKCPLWIDDACTLEYGGCIFRDVVEALEGGQDDKS
jgi:hypothetical protein